MNFTQLSCRTHTTVYTRDLVLVAWTVGMQVFKIKFKPLTYDRTGLLGQYFLAEVMRGLLNVTNTDEF